MGKRLSLGSKLGSSSLCVVNKSLTVTPLWAGMRTKLKWSPGPVGAGATCRSGAAVDWAERGVLQDLFDSLSHDGDFEWLCVHATVIRAHWHASGARRQKGSVMPKV
ncbi:hypothetical protein [Rhizobium mongolense]|uniref:hypothetical protein n=1 Tax=Rhizobium mongolense TaxID=57676 RepID=UPI0035592E2D